MSPFPRNTSESKVWDSNHSIWKDLKQRLSDSKSTIALIAACLLSAVILGADGFHFVCGVLIHTIGLLYPLLSTFKLVKHFVYEQSVREDSLDSQSPTPTTSTSKRSQKNASNNDNNATTTLSPEIEEQCTIWLKFWVTYCSTWFVLSCLVAPILNLIIPAKFLTNVFFLILVTKPHTFGITIFDNIVYPVIINNLAALERIHSSLYAASNDLQDSMSTKLHEFVLETVPNAVKSGAQFVQNSVMSGHQELQAVHAVPVAASPPQQQRRQQQSSGLPQGTPTLYTQQRQPTQHAAKQSDKDIKQKRVAEDDDHVASMKLFHHRNELHQDQKEHVD